MDSTTRRPSHRHPSLNPFLSLSSRRLGRVGARSTNSYGIIRAPWNNNRDMELTRRPFDVCGYEPVNRPVPTCMTHFMLVNQTDLASFLMNVPGYGHGPMHITGGVYGGCKEAVEVAQTATQ